MNESHDPDVYAVPKGLVHVAVVLGLLGLGFYYCSNLVIGVREFKEIHRDKDRYVFIVEYVSGGGAAGFTFVEMLMLDARLDERTRLADITGMPMESYPDVEWVSDKVVKVAHRAYCPNGTREYTWNDLTLVVTFE